MNQIDIKNKSGVRQIEKTKTVVIEKKQETYPVYRVPLKYLYYNDQNDRISTEVIRYCEENNTKIPEDREEYNAIFQELVTKSKEDAIKRTQRSIATRGQDNPGVTLKDGRVVDGNRRFTCLRRIQEETNQEQFFETIILDYDYVDDYKYIKSLELELQMGVDEKIKYDPIDRLFGVYNSIRVHKAFSVEEYAALFDNYSVPEVKKDLRLADLMCEYLKFQGSEGKYYIAKDMELEGILEEIPAVLDKVKKRNENLVDDVKLRIFSSISAGVSSRLNLFIRDLKDVVENGDLEKYLDETSDAVSETIEILSENPVENINDLADGIRKRDDIVESLSTAMNSQKKALDSKKLKKAPIKCSNDAIVSLNAIHIDAIKEMSEMDLEELKALLDRIEDKISEIRGQF